MYINSMKQEFQYMIKLRLLDNRKFIQSIIYVVVAALLLIFSADKLMNAHLL